jgi:multidrug efflux system outer membrane protein
MKLEARSLRAPAAIRRPALALALAALPLGPLSGCKVGPDHEAPELKLPEGWSQGAELGAAATPNAAAAPAVSVDLRAWWKAFNDPTLDALIERARQSNLDLRVARARLREARAERGIAMASGLPAVDASGQYSRGRRSENLGDSGNFLAGPAAGSFQPSGEVQDFWQGGFDASWEIDVFGGVRRKVEAADADAAASEENLRDVLVTLLGEVARNYIELRGLQKEAARTRRNAAAQDSTARLTRSRFEAGVANELDVARAEAQRAATESEIPSLEADADRALHRLSVLLAEAPQRLAPELTGEAPVPIYSADVPLDGPAVVLGRRPDVRRAEQSLHAAAARIGVAKADLYPRLFLNGSVGLESDRWRTLWNADSRFWSLGPSIAWPVFAAGRIRSNIEVFDARHEAALAAYEQAVLVALADVEDALSARRRVRDRWEKLRASAQSSRRALELANGLYESGLVDFLNVLDAQRALFLAESLETRSEKEFSLATVALAKALGGGWDENAPGDAIDAAGGAKPESQEQPAAPSEGAP